MSTDPDRGNLTLTLRVGERLRVQTGAGEVEVTVHDVSRLGRATLTVAAPRKWPILLNDRDR